MVPCTVMPCHVSWQLVVKKSDGSVHTRGAAAELGAAAGALAGATSAAQASIALEAQTAARNAAHTPSFAMIDSNRSHHVAFLVLSSLSGKLKYDCLRRSGKEKS
jgi:hypothetical protein